MSDINLERIATLKTRLADLAPSHIEVIDESHMHVGHAGAKGALRTSGCLSARNNLKDFLHSLVIDLCMIAFTTLCLTLYMRYPYRLALTLNEGHS